MSRNSSETRQPRGSSRTLDGITARDASRSNFYLLRHRQNGAKTRSSNGLESSVSYASSSVSIVVPLYRCGLPRIEQGSCLSIGESSVIVDRLAIVVCIVRQRIPWVGRRDASAKARILGFSDAQRSVSCINELALVITISQSKEH